jgi:hypothetical protein
MTRKKLLLGRVLRKSYQRSNFFCSTNFQTSGQIVVPELRTRILM